MEANTLTKNINGINYELNEQDKTATVCPLDNDEKYEGNIVIPALVIYKEPYRVVGINWGAFEDCSGLISITIPDSVTYIEREAFASCTGLVSVTIPDCVKQILGGAFKDCITLASITIPNNVTKIGCYVFAGCTSLASIIIPDSVTEIEGGTFRGCTSLVSVTIPDTVTKIDWRVFEGCTSLASIIIPDSVAAIGSRAFKGCTSLTSIIIPDSVSAIGESAFEGCTSLASVTVTDSVTNLGDDAFKGTLWYISQPDGPIYIGNYLYAYKGEMSSNTNFVVRDGTTEIKRNAFEGCKGLTSVTIPNSVTSIGDSAFKDCKDLVSIFIPDSIIEISENAFDGTPWYDAQQNGPLYIGKILFGYKGNMLSNTHVVVEDGTIGICSFSLDYNHLVSITFPDSVMSIGELAFNDLQLRTIYVPHGKIDKFCELGLEEWRDKMVEI